VRPSGALADLLGVAVRIGTIRVGEVVGIFVDETGARAIGLEVRSAGGLRRFLPWFAATRASGAITVSSALLLVDDGASYERLGAHAVRDAARLAGLTASSSGRLERTPAVSAGAVAGTQDG
jgi:hypothetical protein